jgi:hypothetical protein
LTSGNYDEVVGVGQSALNSYLKKIYNVIHTKYLHGNYSTPPLNSVGISSIDYDVTLPDPSPINIEEGNPTTPAIITLKCSISLGINYQSGANSTPVTANIQANVTINNNNLLKATITNATVSIASDPLMQQFVNNSVFPSFVQPRINNLIAGSLSTGTIGNISLLGITLMPPKINTINGYLLCYTALASPFSPPPTTGPPPFSPPPTDKLFAIISTSLISKLANAKIEPITGASQMSYTVLGNKITVEVDYRATISKIKVSVGGINKIQATADVSASGTVKSGSLSLPFSSVTGKITLEGTTSIGDKGNLNVTLTLQSIDDLKVNVVPKSTDPIMKLIDAVIDDVGTWIADQIKGSVGHPIISTITINIFGSKISVDEIPMSMTLSNFSPINGFDSNQSLIVAADANFS